MIFSLLSDRFHVLYSFILGTMTRYIRKQRSEPLIFDAKKIVNAVKDLKIKKESERAAAREYGISKTSLRRYKNKIEMKFPIFDEAAEDEMIKFIASTAGWATQTVW